MYKCLACLKRNEKLKLVLKRQLSNHFSPLNYSVFAFHWQNVVSATVLQLEV